MKANMKFPVVRKLWSSCLLLGEAKLTTAFIFFGQGDTCEMFLAKDSILHFLIWHLLGLNLIPTLVVFWIVSRRCMLCFSSVDTWILTSSAQENVPGIPTKAAPICAKNISQEAESK